MPDDNLGEPPSLALSPSALLEAIAAQVDRLHGADAAPVLIRGVPMKTSGTGREYGGFVYAQLKDARTGDAIDTKVPAQLAATLDWGREAVFVGLIHFKAKRGELRPVFRVDSVQEVGQVRLAGKSELLEHWIAAAARPKRDVRSALGGRSPRLVIITGVGSVAIDDIRAQLREAEADLRLDVVRVPINRPKEVAEALRQAPMPTCWR